MRFKVLAVAAVALIAVFGFGLNANAQLVDGVTTNIWVGGSTGVTMVDKDYNLSHGNGLDESDTDWDTQQLFKGSRIVVKGKKGAVQVVGVLAAGDTAFQMENKAWINSVQVQTYYAQYTADNGIALLFGQNSNPSNIMINTDFGYAGHNFQMYHNSQFNPFQVKLTVPAGPG